MRAHYGHRLKKICIDGGFTCPNRDGKCGTGGCIFCGERGAGEHIDPTLSIRETTEAALRAANEGDEFIAYFQNFTNTYAPIDVLRERYDAALYDKRIRILDIGTRPDCISREVCELLCEYKRERDVWVELGLQSADDEVGKAINRGYGRDVFESAFSLLKEYGIPTVVHLIAGLPTESLDGFKRSVDYVSALMPFGVKLHSIYVMKGTRLAKEYEEKRYTPPSLEEFTAAAVYLITHLRKSTVIHRLTGDCPRESLIAPSWNKDKNLILNSIRAALEENGLSQGCCLGGL